MRATGLLILVAATAAAVAGVRVVVLGDETPSANGADRSAEAGSNLLFPDLLTQADQVAELSIESADQTVTLKSQDEGWVLLERGGFPATFDTIQRAFVGMGRLEIVEPKTARAENHARLGVQAPDAPDSASKRVELRRADGTQLASLIVGDRSSAGGGQLTYVRRGDEDQVYLCEGRLDLNATPTSWIEKEIIRLDRERVSEVEVRHADGEVVLVGRALDNANTYELQNGPEGREPKSAGIANGVGTALSYLSLEDVRSVASVDFQAEPLASTLYRCEDGLVVTAETARFEDQVWLKLNASYEAPAEAVGPAAGEPDSEATEAPEDEGAEGEEPGAAAEEEEEAQAAEAPDPDAVRAEVEALNARLNGWAYTVPEYKVDVIARRMEDLLAPLEGEGDEEAIPGLSPDGELPFSNEELQQLLEAQGIELPADPPADSSATTPPAVEPEVEPTEGAPAAESEGEPQAESGPGTGETADDGR